MCRKIIRNPLNFRIYFKNKSELRFIPAAESARMNRLHLLIADRTIPPESELLLLIPNNKKRMLGLPLTRIPSKNKRHTKNKRKSQVFKSHFDFVDKCIAKAIAEEIDKMLDGFVDIKNLMLGEPDIYNWEIL